MEHESRSCIVHHTEGRPVYRLRCACGEVIVGSIADWYEHTRDSVGL